MADKKRSDRIVPVILAGGSGTRLWPLSRRQCPKQFLPLVDKESLLVATCRRVADPRIFSPPIVICNTRHRDLLARQLREADIVSEVTFLEPIARGTATAAAVVALFVARTNPESLLLVLAADSHVRDSASFLAGIMVGAEVAAAGRIVLFGITPSRPDTGFGYIRVGEAIGRYGANSVEAFIEKPNRAQAETLIASGQYLWNSGNFLFRVNTLLREFERLQPAVLEACSQALSRSAFDAGCIVLDEASLAGVASDSLDRTIMERTSFGAVVPIAAGWNDLGSWDALWSESKKDMNGNSLIGDAIVTNSKNSYIRSEERLVTAVGVTDLVVIETGDAVFVAPRNHASDAKEIVEHLLRLNRREAHVHPLVRESWGCSRRIGGDDHFLASLFIVDPGGQLYWEVIRDRVEHWIVTLGTACIAHGDQKELLRVSESLRLVAGPAYKIENTEHCPLHLIAIQIDSRI